MTNPDKKIDNRNQEENQKIETTISFKDRLRKIAHLIAEGTAFAVSVLLTPVTALREIFHPTEIPSRGELETPKPEKEPDKPKEELVAKEKPSKEGPAIPKELLHSKVLTCIRDPKDPEEIIIKVSSDRNICSSVYLTGDEKEDHDRIANILDGLSAKLLEENGAFAIPTIKKIQEVQKSFRTQDPEYCITRAATTVQKVTVFGDIKTMNKANGSFEYEGKMYDFSGNYENVSVREKGFDRDANLPDDVMETISRIALHEISIIKDAAERVKVSSRNVSRTADGKSFTVDGSISIGKVESKFHYDLSSKLITFEPDLSGIKNATGISRYMQAYSRQQIRESKNQELTGFLKKELVMQKREPVLSWGNIVGEKGSFTLSGKAFSYTCQKGGEPMFDPDTLTKKTKAAIAEFLKNNPLPDRKIPIPKRQEDLER